MLTTYIRHNLTSPNFLVYFLLLLSSSLSSYINTAPSITTITQLQQRTLGLPHKKAQYRYKNTAALHSQLLQSYFTELEQNLDTVQYCIIAVFACTGKFTYMKCEYSKDNLVSASQVLVITLSVGSSVCLLAPCEDHKAETDKCWSSVSLISFTSFTQHNTVLNLADFLLYCIQNL